MTPQKGFYYHYKHSPVGEVGNYAYEVLNIAHHTEIDNLEEGALVIYRPLYHAKVYEMGKRWDARPLTMFTEDVEVGGKNMHRFTRITDPKIIEELEAIRDRMYA
jgi:hypothetical protein